MSTKFDWNTLAPRPQINEEPIDTLHEHEMDDSARLDRMERECENRWKDANDVFFQARDRREQIKEQIKDLQHGLDRLKPKHQKKPASTRRKTGKSR